MNLVEFLDVFQVFHSTDHATKAGLELVIQAEITVDKLSRWRGEDLERIGDLIDRVLSAVSPFEEDLVTALRETRDKVSDAVKLAAVNAKKPRARKAKPGDANQGGMFDEDEPMNDLDSKGDPG